MKEPNVECKFCGKPFYKKPNHIQRCKDHYCCREHHHLDLRKDMEMVYCKECGVEIPLTPQRRRNSKTGLYFCGNLCKNRYIARKNRWSEDPDYHRKRRPEVIKKAEGKCESCGYHDDERMLDIHHINGNHSDNRWENLMCACVWCHAKHHRCVELIGQENSI